MAGVVVVFLQIMIFVTAVTVMYVTIPLHGL